LWARAAENGDQELNFFDVNVDYVIALRCGVRNSDHADATLQHFATNHDLDYLTRSRHITLVKI
jgi:hypothetical protein